MEHLAQFALPGTVGFQLGARDGITALLTAHGSRATVALTGAQVLSFVPAGGRDLLWVSPVSRPGPGKAIRGGVPVCWPWFGVHPSDASKPAHGFVRTRPWRVLETDGEAGAARIALGYETRPEDLQLWPHGAHVRLDVTLSDVLKLDLTTLNTGEAEFPLTQALHTYLAISDVANAVIEGLDGRSYMDHVGPKTRREQHGPIVLDREINRVYDRSEDTIAVVDRGFGRRITIGKRMSRATVAWNPWIEFSERLGDMGPDGYRRMVCVETANAGEDVIALAPGKAHTLTAIVGCGSL